MTHQRVILQAQQSFLSQGRPPPRTLRLLFQYALSSSSADSARSQESRTCHISQISRGEVLAFGPKPQVVHCLRNRDLGGGGQSKGARATPVIICCRRRRSVDSACSRGLEWLSEHRPLKLMGPPFCATVFPRDIWHRG